MRKSAYDKLMQLDIEYSGDAYTKELNQIRFDNKNKLTAWEDEIRNLAKEYIKTQHDIFMSKKGADENKWEDYAKLYGLDDVDKVIERMKSDDTQLHTLAEQFVRTQHDIFMQKKGATEKSWEDFAKKQGFDVDAITNSWKEHFSDIAKYYNDVRLAIINNGQRKERDAREKHYDQLIEDYGNYEQRYELLSKKQFSALAFLPDEFREQAIQTFQEQFGELNVERMKQRLNWDELFSGLDNASASSIRLMISRTESELAKYGQDMTAEQKREFTDALDKMNEELVSRNPFSLMHKSLKDLKVSQKEITDATREYQDALIGVHGWEMLEKSALEQMQRFQDEVTAGRMSEDDEKYIRQQQLVAEMHDGLVKARDKETQAYTKLINAQNKARQSYRNLATGMKAAGEIMGDIGDNAKNLAKCFSDDVADAIGIALDTMDEIIDGADKAINAIGDIAKGTAKSVEATVDAASQGAKASAAAGATAMSTMEKASVILTIISAALQIATAIVNLFNNDSAHEKEIEALQRRIDQLQWELDNAETVRLQNELGSALERVRNTYEQIYQSLLKLHSAEISNGNMFRRIAYQNQLSAEAWRRSIEKIADAYAGVAYTADKALGAERFTSARKQLENLAEQQTLVYRQLQEEQAKKKTDKDKVADYEQQIAELAQSMADIINDALEEIIGNTAADLASELGDAFFDACASGEDALDAWHAKAQDVVRDITKRMLISKFLEEPLGKIFDKYKTRWFGDDGRFRGIDNVINSMNDFSADIDAVGDSFNEIFNSLPDQMKEIFTDSAERNGTQGGIATASQDSVDELNARITTIQGHTYNIMQAVQEMNVTSTAMLDRLAGIERNTGDTSAQLATVERRVRNIETALDDITSKGIKVR